jgi:hypothetical protein
MSRTEIAERRHLRNWLDQSLIEMDLDALRFVACVAAIRLMGEKELDAVVKHLNETKKDETKT